MSIVLLQKTPGLFTFHRIYIYFWRYSMRQALPLRRWQIGQSDCDTWSLAILGDNQYRGFARIRLECYGNTSKQVICISASNIIPLVVECVLSDLYYLRSGCCQRGVCVCVLTAERMPLKFSNREQKVSLYEWKQVWVYCRVDWGEQRAPLST